MKTIKKNTTPERLLLGLAMGLAGSLCALEYGKPLIELYTMKGEVAESITYMEDLPPLTFPKPKQQPEPDIVKPKPISTEFVIIEANVDYVDDRKSLPEFNFDDINLFNPEQGGDPNIDLEIPFVKVEVKPHFDDLSPFLARNIRYPKRMKEQGLEGVVGVQFTVGADGIVKPESIKIVDSTHPDFSREVIRVMKLMPAWIPGEQRGKKVAVTHTLPIWFKLKT